MMVGRLLDSYHKGCLGIVRASTYEREGQRIAKAKSVLGRHRLSEVVPSVLRAVYANALANDAITPQRGLRSQQTAEEGLQAGGLRQHHVHQPRRRRQAPPSPFTRRSPSSPPSGRRISSRSSSHSPWAHTPSRRSSSSRRDAGAARRSASSGGTSCSRRRRSSSASR